MAEIKLNADFLNDLYACKDVNGVIALAKTKGIDLTEEQAGKVFESLQGRELTDEELEQVTGGAMGPNVAGVIGSAVVVGILTLMFNHSMVLTAVNNTQQTEISHAD